MGKLIYTSIVSLDGYIEDDQGSFDWARPDEEVHQFVNDRERSVGTYLYGRRMYETMQYWETVPPSDSPAGTDYTQIWRSADKVVYSRTLDSVSSGRTRIAHDFDPEEVRTMKATTGTDLSIGGPGLAAAALAAHLVDEIHLLVVPLVVGSGKPSLRVHRPLALELIDERRFASGVVHLGYRTT